MTQDRALKQAIRRRMKQTGEKYTEARRELLAAAFSDEHYPALTVEQRALLPEFRKRWMPYCVHTGPADRATAEEALASAYVSAGLAPPANMSWRDSPLAGHIQAGALAVERERHRRRGKIEEEILGKLAAGLRASGAEVGAGFDCGESVFEQLREAAQGDIDRHLRGEVTGAVWVDVIAATKDRGVSSGIWLH